MIQAMRKKKIETHDAEETVKLSPAEVAKWISEDSQQIERAVYDGMQDLRIKKPAGQ